jgi:NIMA-interacting peptidyl-prolyl cis-trans isomerase 4
MPKNDKKGGGGKGKGGGGGGEKDTGGKAKGAQSINVRHILVCPHVHKLRVRGFRAS